MVVPDRKALEDWAINHNVTGDFNSLCENLKAKKYILDELNNTGHKNQVCTCVSIPIANFMQSYVFSSDLKDILQLRGFEMLKAVHLEPNPFDMDRDLITPTFKLKRPQLLKYYKVCLVFFLFFYLFFSLSFVYLTAHYCYDFLLDPSFSFPCFPSKRVKNSSFQKYIAS